MTRMIGYSRVSTEEQGRNGYGLDAQRAAIDEKAARHKWAVKHMADEASGKQVNPGLRDALGMLAQGRADGLVVSRLDRLARSLLDFCHILDRAKAQGWRLVVCEPDLDFTSPAGRMTAQVMASFAEFERELIGARTREGLAAAKARGVRIGRPRLVTPDLIDRIITDRDAGATFGEIARALTAEEILTPAGQPVWRASTVRRIYITATDHTTEEN